MPCIELVVAGTVAVVRTDEGVVEPSALPAVVVELVEQQVLIVFAGLGY